MTLTENIKSTLQKLWNADPRRSQIILTLLLAFIACTSILTTRLFMYRHIHQKDISASEAAFEEMYYPTLDRLYESGDLAELQREVGRLSMQEGASALVRWPHISYLHYYTQGTMVEYACSAFADGNDTVQTMSSGVWAALTILFKQDDFEKNENFSESDRLSGNMLMKLPASLQLTSASHQNRFMLCMMPASMITEKSITKKFRSI